MSASSWCAWGVLLGRPAGRPSSVGISNVRAIQGNIMATLTSIPGKPTSIHGAQLLVRCGRVARLL